jgi:hypothetical protein
MKSAEFVRREARNAGVSPAEQAASRRHRRIEGRPNAPARGKGEILAPHSSRVRIGVDLVSGLLLQSSTRSVGPAFTPGT